MTHTSGLSSPLNRHPHSRIVLVEDDENVRRSTTMLLRARGFQVDAYRSGAEFLTVRGQHGGDCLLIDYKMPHVDGLEVMRRLRLGNDRTPGIMVTGFYSNSLNQRALQAGFAKVIEKPATPSIVVEAIESVFLKPLKGCRQDDD